MPSIKLFLSIAIKQYLLHFCCCVVLLCVNKPSFAFNKDPTVAGKINFFNHANAKFDIYSAKPDSLQQQWMQQHYQRMLSYTPYFDSRLAWYPKAWFYLDSYAIYVDSKTAKEHPNWIMRDVNTNPLYIPWECQKKPCDQFVGDFSNPEFRNYKIEEIRTALAKGYGGVWLDDVNLTWRVSDIKGTQIIPWDYHTRKLMLLKDWRRYFVEYLEAIRQAFPTIEIAHNAIWYADNKHEDDALIERQIAAADYINIERGGNDSGLVAGNGLWGYETFLQYLDTIHQHNAGVILMDSATTTKEREYGLATWLLVSNGLDLFNSNQLNWTAPDHWWSGYEANLGKALTDRYTWQAVLRRDFECGQVLLNQPGLKTQTLKLEKNLQTLDGKSVEKITLPEKSAVILVKPCKT